MAQKPFYITTAIAYPNNRMHVGFGWEVIASDAVARFQRMRGREVFFSTGVDEHSQNVEKSAVAAALEPKKYCDQMAEDIKKVMASMDIAYDRFIRTSDPDHEKVCKALVERAFKAGDVYKQNYEGLYCESCEVFYTEKEALESPTGPQCSVHKLPLKRTKEENYFFKLSKYEQKLKEYFKAHPDFLLPEGRRNEILSFLENGLKDFSVSRTSFKWGIPLPFDPQHIIYVWYDALINYLSAVGYLDDPELFKKFWPADVHVIGKDITRFHTIYWPAMLWSAGIELPKSVFAHGFLYYQGEKMSKTRGNIVTPDGVVADYGVTSLRWFLLAANSFAGDGNFSDQDMILKCNADLSNNMGNLVNRSINMAIKYFPEGVPQLKGAPAFEGSQSIRERMQATLGVNGENLISAMDAMDVSGYCARVQEFAMSMNKFIDDAKPWSLAKAAATDPKAKEVLGSVLAQLLEGVHNLGTALWPIIPAAAEGILGQLGSVSDMWNSVALKSGRSIRVPDWKSFGFREDRTFSLQTPSPLFPRLEMK